jgi:hypothetical protein
MVEDPEHSSIKMPPGAPKMSVFMGWGWQSLHRIVCATTDCVIIDFRKT